MSNEQSSSTSELEYTVLDSLANHQPDTTLVKTLVGESMGERNVSEDADADELLSAYENWAYAVGELKLAEDTYHNAEIDSEEAEEAEQEKNAAESEASSYANDVKRALRTYLGS